MSTKLDKIIRWLAIIAIAGIVFALSMAEDSSDRWHRKIAEGFEQGVLGRLEERHHNWLRSVLDKTLPALEALSDEEPPYALNETPSDQRLDIITFKPNAAAVPGLADLVPGNALYVKPIDTIFLDAELVRFAYGEEAGAEIGPEVRFLFLYTLAHEIGHRRLHGLTSALHRLERKSVRVSQGRLAELEAEADHYAISRIQSALKRADGRVALSDFFEFWTSSLSSDLINSDTDPILLALTSSVEILTRWLAIGGGQMSSYRFDTSHPTFVDRLESMIGAAADRSSGDRNTMLLVEYLQENLRHLREMDAIVACETFMSQGVHDIIWRDGVLELVDGTGIVGSIAQQLIETRASADEYCFFDSANAQYQASLGSEGRVEKFAYGHGAVLYNWTDGQVRWRASGEWTTSESVAAGSMIENFTVDALNHDEAFLLLGENAPTLVEPDVIAHLLCETYKNCGSRVHYLNEAAGKVYFMATQAERIHADKAQLFAAPAASPGGPFEHVGTLIIPGEVATREFDVRIGLNAEGHITAYVFISGIKDNRDYFAIHEGSLVASKIKLKRLLLEYPVSSKLPLDLASGATQKYMDPYISKVLIDPRGAAILMLGYTEYPILVDLHNGRFNRIAVYPDDMRLSEDRRFLALFSRDESTAIRSWLIDMQRLSL